MHYRNKLALACAYALMGYDPLLVPPASLATVDHSERPA